MGKKIEHDGCIGCKHESKTPADMPCKVCKQNYVDKYKPMPKATNFEKITESAEKLADVLLMLDAKELTAIMQYCNPKSGCDNDCKRCLIKYLYKEAKEVEYGK